MSQRRGVGVRGKMSVHQMPIVTDLEKHDQSRMVIVFTVCVCLWKGFAFVVVCCCC